MKSAIAIAAASAIAAILTPHSYCGESMLPGMFE